ncbi:Uncharacterised protein [Vibrio paracholerae]|nr:Uncharacterised protein [Vibrio paracholerae]
MWREGGLYGCRQLALVPLYSQQVITAFVGNYLGNFGLAGHRINRHEGFAQVEHLNQFRNCGDFIALIVSFELAQYQLVDTRVSAHHMNGTLSVISIVRAAQSLTVNGNHLTTRQGMYRIHPAQEAVVKLGRVNTCDQTNKGIVNRHAVFKQTLFKKPLMVTKNIFTNVRSALTSAYHGAD